MASLTLAEERQRLLRVGEPTISYLLNAALVVCLPLSRSGKKWTVATATVLGVLMALWSGAGVRLLSAEVKLLPGLPTAAGPGVPAVLGALIALFGVRAYQRLP